MVRALALVSAFCVSFGWLAWTWNDQTLAEWRAGWKENVMREQTREDHLASVLFAVARVVVAMSITECVVRSMKERVL